MEIRMKKKTIAEANPGAKIINDPKMTKMMSLAIRHDPSIPGSIISRVGPRATDEDYVKLWSNLIDNSLANSDYGDLSRDGKFDNWLTKLYLNHTADYEDINGEGVHALGAWRALSQRGLLDPQDQDFNKFPTLEKFKIAMNKQKYRDILQKIKDDAKLEKIKRDAREFVLIDDDRFHVAVPLNYGACYIFNNAGGVTARFCTGSSTGLTWFDRYSSDGPIVMITDKQNMDEPEGKWQMHSATNQLVSAFQQNRYTADKEFAELFPGLMKKIVDTLSANAEVLTNSSRDYDISRRGWNMQDEIERIKSKYPTAYNSKPPLGREASEEELNHLFGRDRNNGPR